MGGHAVETNLDPVPTVFDTEDSWGWDIEGVGPDPYALGDALRNSPHGPDALAAILELFGEDVAERASCIAQQPPSYDRGVEPVQLTASNSVVRRSGEEPLQDDALATVAQLEAMGYSTYPIEAANVLNENPTQPGAQEPNGAAPHAPGVYNMGGVLAAHGYDVIINGAFYAAGNPLGSVMRDGCIDNVGMRPETATRGAFAILENGTMVLARSDGLNQRDLSERFDQPDARVADVVGGGIMLAEAGHAVDDEGLRAQYVDPQRLAGDTNPFQVSQHTFVGIRNGVMYALVAHGARSGRQILDDMLAAGFETVLKLDGGSGFHAVDDVGDIDSDNPVSIGIKEWRTSP